MTRPGRLIHALRYVDDELMRAGEAIIRSARVPRPGRPDQAAEVKTRDTNERVGRAA